MANEKVLTLDNENFKTAIEDDTPILVDFWASWCGPCRMVAPVLDEIAEQFDGKVRVGKLDVDASQAVASEYQVQSIPTFILFKNGKAQDRMMGAMPKAAFEQFIERNA